MSVSSESATTSGPGNDDDSSFSLDVERQTVPGAVRSYFQRLRSGDPGALPSVLGLVVLVVIFSQVSDRFLSANNIGNLPGQGAYIAVIGMGLVFVLLLGEIDLSAGTTGGMCAGFAARAVFSGNLHDTVPTFLYWTLIIAMLAAIALAIWLKAYTAAVVVAIGLVLFLTNLVQHVTLAIVAAVALGAAVGVFTGFMVAKVGIPSFIVTLALFLAWQGVLLFALNSQPIGTTNYKIWYNLSSANLSPTWSWVFTLVVLAGYLGFTLWKSITAQRAGLAHDALSLVLVRGGILAAVGIVVTILANRNRNTNPYLVIAGLPWAAVIAITLMIACSLALNKTTWGRHLYATGGNEEAARRAGIDVVHIKVTAFTLCSAFGALGGVLLASSSHSVSLDLGAGNILLFSVAAAVIGGTSLFGGRGKPRDAVIGALVIVIIPNGLGLRPNLGVQYQQVITGVVLLAAAAVDALSRKRTARN
ncbi:ABC transporter permease [Nocardioides sp.]|jgi:D-xylose transport system permease protein|uniref:sugar ABC transporter permease n=1 Tax=Nocardioides sp. TaxID=35761 RepID=UPI0031FEB8E0|nr:inner-rane translocator [Nocardioides sp.]